MNSFKVILYLCDINKNIFAYMTTTEKEPKKCDVTLGDIYNAFGNQKKHYSIRLKHAFLEHYVETIDDMMALSLNDLQKMHGIGSETLRLMIKKLNGLGIDYYPVVKTK